MSGFIKYIAILLVLFSFSGKLTGQLSVAEMLRYGDMSYEKGNYGSAIHFYKMIVDESLKVERISSFPYAHSVYTGETKKVNVPDSIQTVAPENKVEGNELYATHMIAECSRLMNDYAQADLWYVQSLQLNWGSENDEYPLDRYWYASILMNEGNYNQAIEELNTFVLDNETPTEETQYYITRAKELINSCTYAQSANSKTKAISVKKGDSLLNNGTSSYAATYSNLNNIIISSARNTSTEDKEKKIESKYLSDIFTMRKTGNRWEGALAINDPVNTPEHEGAASVIEDEKTMYFTRWYVDQSKESEIMVSKYFVDRWMKPRSLGESVNLKGYSSQHPYVTKDNKTLFFASDRPGGQGGMDIWMCTIDRKGMTSDPINLGPTINTPEDEITPYFHEATSVLYFSSKGHTNLGGFDIFKSNFSTAHNYAADPINMGSPINSSKNDTYFCLTDLQTEGFLTSNRDECVDCGTGFCNQIYTVTKHENQFLLTGYVYDMDTYEPIPNATITVKDVLGEFSDYNFETDSSGYYELPLSPEMHIFIKAQKLEYFADANVQSTIGLSESEEFTIDFYLPLIPYEEIEIPGILYDYDKATLRPESMVILDSLIEFLTINDNLIIEISSHTDQHGGDAYNLKLSQKRAESVVNYLIDNGIPNTRLVAKGYGETIPIVKDAQTDEDDQKNRRTSFRILSENFEEIDKIRPKNR